MNTFPEKFQKVIKQIKKYISSIRKESQVVEENED